MRSFDARLIAAGGTANHIHLLISVGKNHLLPDMIGAIKRDSSKWIKTKGGKMLTKFGWQDGYSAFSVGHTQVATVRGYLARQKEHHRATLFEDEIRAFYRKYDIDSDEQYARD